MTSQPQPAIHIQQASLTYKRYAQPRDALWEWLSHTPRHRLFHALQDISLTLASGSSLGVIGDNGAGKSTFLKMLAGNLPPTAGECVVHGKQSALLELGTGLQPELSGIANAQLGLALRGLNRQEIDQRLPDVLQFAELNEFAHQPVKTYSSGMIVRLAFAVASIIEPDVLIVDEALSVGDQYFQKKSLDRMRAILRKGATLVFCSHNLYQIREMCQQALWLEHGQIKMLGDVQSVVDAYQDALRARQVTPSFKAVQPSIPSIGASPYLVDVSLNRDLFHTLDTFIVTVHINPAWYAHDDIHVGIVIRRNDDVQCFGISSLHDKIPLIALPDGLLTTQFVVDQLPLLSGEYCLEVWLIDSSGVHVYDSRERCCHFRVQQDSQNQGVGMVWLPHHWQTIEVEEDALAS
jgi:lipopolysaccharide transport system ATP-binding protein